MLAVHLGAGYHAPSNETLYKSIAFKSLECTSIVDAIIILEAFFLIKDSDLTNAGFGSNLNADGVVECDASYINSEHLFGAIGCASGICPLKRN